ncbi:hypothetical protein D3C77_605180 [compost metagenome]
MSSSTLLRLDVVSKKVLVNFSLGLEKIEKTSPCSKIIPWSMIATLLHISLMTPISWVIITIVIPSFRFKSFRNRKIDLVVCGSSALVASSHNNILG